MYQCGYISPKDLTIFEFDHFHLHFTIILFILVRIQLNKIENFHFNSNPTCCTIVILLHSSISLGLSTFHILFLLGLVKYHRYNVCISITYSSTSFLAKALFHLSLLYYVQLSHFLWFSIFIPFYIYYFLFSVTFHSYTTLCTLFSVALSVGF